MSLNNLDATLMSSGLFMFCGEPILEFNQDEYADNIHFITLSGCNGNVEPSYNGNYNIWINEELIYEIEKEIFDIMCISFNEKGIDIIDLYLKLIDIMKIGLKNKSKNFLEVLIWQTEMLIMDPNVPINKDIQIGCMYLFNYNYDNKNNKFITSLN